MAGMLEYKCPCCDGAIQFDSATHACQELPGLNREKT